MRCILAHITTKPTHLGENDMSKNTLNFFEKSLDKLNFEDTSDCASKNADKEKFLDYLVQQSVMNAFEQEMENKPELVKLVDQTIESALTAVAVREADEVYDLVKPFMEYMTRAEKVNVCEVHKAMLKMARQEVPREEVETFLEDLDIKVKNMTDTIDLIEKRNKAEEESKQDESILKAWKDSTTKMFQKALTVCNRRSIAKGTDSTLPLEFATYLEENPDIVDLTRDMNLSEENKRYFVNQANNILGNYWGSAMAKDIVYTDLSAREIAENFRKNQTVKPKTKLPRQAEYDNWGTDHKPKQVQKKEHKYTHVDILGADWLVLMGSREAIELAEDVDGICMFHQRTIKVVYEYDEEFSTQEEVHGRFKATIVHEVIHAFMHESGMTLNYTDKADEVVSTWLGKHWFSIDRVVKFLLDQHNVK